MLINTLEDIEAFSILYWYLYDKIKYNINDNNKTITNKF